MDPRRVPFVVFTALVAVHPTPFANAESASQLPALYAAPNAAKPVLPPQPSPGVPDIPARDDVRSAAELVDVLAHAYRSMDIDLYATVFANAKEHEVEFRFVLYEPTEKGETEWGYDEEIRIHRRMFDPESVLPGEREVPRNLWLRSIDVEFVQLREWAERFDLYRSEHNPSGPLDRHRWRATDAEYGTSVTWHTIVGGTMHIEGQARFVVIEDLTKQVGERGKLLVYRWEDLGPVGAGLAAASP